MNKVLFQKWQEGEVDHSEKLVWKKLLVPKFSLTTHTAFNRKDNPHPASITAITPSRFARINLCSFLNLKFVFPSKISEIIEHYLLGIALVAFGAGRLEMKLVHALTTGCKIQVEIHAHNACKNFRLPKGDITAEIVGIFFAIGKFVFFVGNFKEMDFAIRM